MSKGKRKLRIACDTTLLVVGEGPDDKAFIDHMKRLFQKRQRGVKGPKIEAGDGGSADVIITNSIRAYRHQAYTRKLLVLDSDIPPSPAKEREAVNAGFDIILWRPQCLEGALLDVLGEPVNAFETSQNLKRRLHPMLSGKHTDPGSYANLFPKIVLESTQNISVSSVRDVIRA